MKKRAGYILVGYLSACEYWNTVGPAFLRTWQQRRVATRKARTSLAASEKPQLSGGGLRPGGCRLPLCVLVGDESARTTTASIASRYWKGPVPEGSFVEAGDGFLVSTPEFAFLQRANDLDLVGLILFGFELCGRYSIDIGSGCTSQRSRPLTTVEKLTAFLERAQGAHGRKKALRALRYLIDGSASPRETALVMLLTLPRSLGGFALKKPQLNYSIDRDNRSQAMSKRSRRDCDLYWPEEKLAIEYDSDKYHTGSENISSDTKRRNDLVFRGVTIIGVTKLQMNDAEELRKVARQIAHRMGKKLRSQTPAQLQAYHALRARLDIAKAHYWE